MRGSKRQLKIEAEEIFKNIEESSNMIANEMEYLNQSIDEMSPKKEKILEGVNKIATVTEQSTELVKEVSVGVENQSKNIEQVSHNSEELVNMAKGLEEKISVFSTVGGIESSSNAIDVKSKRETVKYFEALRSIIRFYKFKSITAKKLNLKGIDFGRYKKRFKYLALLKKVKK
ncbi:hypothetical protein R9X47_06700 [Wukongibacter baidiensis]|uniref:hypothetical protein n=1 Tax=Wukongibacter baidiensis TaxID=1723361 RepID=UPI003D7FA103